MAPFTNASATTKTKSFGVTIRIFDTLAPTVRAPESKAYVANMLQMSAISLSTNLI